MENSTIKQNGITVPSQRTGAMKGKGVGFPNENESIDFATLLSMNNNELLLADPKIMENLISQEPSKLTGIIPQAQSEAKTSVKTEVSDLLLAGAAKENKIENNLSEKDLAQIMSQVVGKKNIMMQAGKQPTALQDPFFTTNTINERIQAQDQAVGLKEYGKKSSKNQSQLISSKKMNDIFLENSFPASSNPDGSFVVDSKDSMMSQLGKDNSGLPQAVSGAENKTTLMQDLALQLEKRIENSAIFKVTPAPKQVDIEIQHSELGSLKFQITRQARDLEIKVASSHADVRLMLNEHRDSLVQHLASKGLNVTDFSIDSAIVKSTDDSKIATNAKENFSQHGDLKNQHGTPGDETGRDRREELWKILKEKREALHA